MSMMQCKQMNSQSVSSRLYSYNHREHIISNAMRQLSEHYVVV